MKRNIPGLAGALALALISCSAPAARDADITDMTEDELPEEVRALAEAAAEGFVISEVQKKVREGRTYFDVEGTLPDGGEIEFDILMTPAGPEIVEIQRDLDWSDAPEAVRAAAPGVQPARVIESTQTDGTIIYELFAPGAPADPAMEIALGTEGDVRVLEERWPH
ncbi:MAG: hypothetical protein ACK4P2_07860 [Hyphomonas sp.]